MFFCYRGLDQGIKGARKKTDYSTRKEPGHVKRVVATREKIKNEKILWED